MRGFAAVSYTHLDVYKRQALDSRLVDQLKRTVTDALTAPVAMLLGWVGLLVSAYPSLWGKDGTASFKLDAWIYYHAVEQWHGGGSLYGWYAKGHRC